MTVTIICLLYSTIPEHCTSASQSCWHCVSISGCHFFKSSQFLANKRNQWDPPGDSIGWPPEGNHVLVQPIWPQTNWLLAPMRSMAWAARMGCPVTSRSCNWKTYAVHAHTVLSFHGCALFPQLSATAQVSATQCLYSIGGRKGV